MTNERFTEALVSLLNEPSRHMGGQGLWPHALADIDFAKVDPTEPTCFTVTVDGRRRRVEVIYA